MQITREKLIEVKGKKEKVSVSFDIPISAFKTTEQAIDEYGDIFEDSEYETSEQVIDEAYGAIARSVLSYLSVALVCEGDSGVALELFQNSINDSAVKLIAFLNARREVERMS